MRTASTVPSATTANAAIKRCRSGPSSPDVENARNEGDSAKTSAVRITPHSLDLPFMFDNVGRAPHMVGPPTAETAALAHAMSEAWLAFARTGNPNHVDIPHWKPYDLQERTVMLFDTRSAAQSDPHRDERLAMEAYPTQQRNERWGIAQSPTAVPAADTRDTSARDAET